MFAHVVRYEVGREENAEAFVEEVLRSFDAMQDRIPEMIGSLLLTRPEDGEAIQLAFFETEEDARAAESGFHAEPAPETGAREVVTGRRPDSLQRPLWHAWQGHWNIRTGDTRARSAG